MKRLIWIIIGFVLLAAVLIPTLTKEKLDNNNIGNAKKSSSKTFTKPKNIDIDNDSVIVKIIDIKGAEINLTSFNSICKKNYDGINYNRAVLSDVFEKQEVIPIQIEGGPYYMYYIDNIDEYFFDGNEVHILLKNGKKITGLQVKDYEISGKSEFGDITLPMENLRYAKFNDKVVSESNGNFNIWLVDNINNSNHGYWPDSFKIYNSNIVTHTNQQLNIKAPIFVYNRHGCDESWIPCKSYQVWELSNHFIPVKRGTIILKVPVSNIELAAFNIVEKEYEKDYYLDITLKNNEKLTDVLLYNGKDGYESDFCVNVGILGIIENGFAFLPVDRIQKLKIE